MGMKTADVPLDPRDAAEIECLLRPYLDRLGARLILFGSRARGDARPGSDIDLAIQAEAPTPDWLLAEIREQLAESQLPWEVDVVDYRRAPPELQQAIDREGIPWPM